jgi:beta-glucosidase
VPSRPTDAGRPARATVDAFTRFAELVGRRLGDRVRYWITINEPWCCAFMGYGSGEHAPGRRDARLALAAAHNLLLAHGRAVEVLRSTSPGANVGIALNPAPVEAASESPRDLAAARRVDGQRNRWFLDPLYGRGYPADMVDYFGAQLEPTSPADLSVIAAPTDFLGVNYYQPSIVRAAADEPLLGAREVRSASERLTSNDWVVRASGLRDVLARIAADYPVGRLVVTENGAAYADPQPDAGRVHDLERVRFLAEHVVELAHAIEVGAPVSGYFVWSLLDNFEWARGYADRFGLVHVDYATQRRTLKDSGRWYRSLIRSASGQTGPD